MYLLIELPNSLICEKIYNCKNIGRNSLLLTIEQLFFQNSKLCNYAMEGRINKEGFLN